jgi:hypothetical protein
MDDFDHIREPLIRKAASLTGETPVNIVVLARQLGVVEIEPRSIEFDGYLARRPDGGLAIRYRRGASPARTRFTIAHEVGHMLIAGELGREVATPVARSDFRDSSEERLANRIASELLMPERSMYEHLQSAAVAWNTIDRIARLLEVSRDSLLVRLAELPWLAYLELSRQLPTGLLKQGAIKLLSLRTGRLFFEAQPTALLARLTDELGAAGGRSQHSITVWIHDVPRRIQMIGRHRSVRGQSVPQFVHWSVHHRESRHTTAVERIPARPSDGMLTTAGE